MDSADDPNWIVVVIGISTLVLEVWMLMEAFLMWPKVKGITETDVGGQKSPDDNSSVSV